MPGWMTFVVNTEKVSVFPERLFYFTDGKRDIKVSGLQEGNTTLYVKIGNQTIKTIPLKVFTQGKTIYPSSSSILSPSKITLWDEQTWIVVFSDNSGKKLINLQYGSTFNIKASDDNQICIKQGDIKDIKKIYKSDCSDDEFQNEFNFDYSDTVGWLLIFDYKAIENPSLPFYWAHSKIPPGEKLTRIRTKVREGSDSWFYTNTRLFVKTFFPVDSLFMDGSTLGLVAGIDSSYMGLRENVVRKALEVGCLLTPKVEKPAKKTYL